MRHLLILLLIGGTASCAQHILLNTTTSTINVNGMGYTVTDEHWVCPGDTVSSLCQSFHRKTVVVNGARYNCDGDCEETVRRILAGTYDRENEGGESGGGGYSPP